LQIRKSKEKLADIERHKKASRDLRGLAKVEPVRQSQQTQLEVLVVENDGKDSLTPLDNDRKKY
jgi:hypothetical protein